MNVSYTTNFSWRDEENFPHYDLFKTFTFTNVPLNNNPFFSNMSWVSEDESQTIMSNNVANYQNLLFKIESNNVVRYFFVDSIVKAVDNGYVVKMKLDKWATYLMNSTNWNNFTSTYFNFIRSPFFHKDTLFITDPKINSIISNIEDRAYYKQSLSSDLFSIPSSDTIGYKYAKDSLYAVFNISPADISYNSSSATDQYFVKANEGGYKTIQDGRNTFTGLDYPTHLLRNPMYVMVPLFGDSNSSITQYEAIANQLLVNQFGSNKVYFANSSRGVSKLVNASFWNAKFKGIYEGIPFSSWNQEDMFFTFLSPWKNILASNFHIRIPDTHIGNSASTIFISFFTNQVVGTKVKGFNFGLSQINNGIYLNGINNGVNYSPLLKYLDMKINGGKCNASALYYHSILNGLNGSILPDGWITFNNRFMWYTKTDEIVPEKTLSTKIEFPLMSPYSTSGYSEFINANQNSLDTSFSNRLINGIAGTASSLMPTGLGLNTLLNVLPSLKNKSQKENTFNYGMNMTNTGAFGMLNPILSTIANMRSINATKLDAYNSSKPNVKANDEGMENTQENITSNYSQFNLTNSIGGSFISVKNITTNVWNSLKNYMYLYNYYCYQYRKINENWDTTDCGYFEFIDDNLFIKLTQAILSNKNIPLVTDNTISWFIDTFSNGVRIWKTLPTN